MSIENLFLLKIFVKCIVFFPLSKYLFFFCFGNSIWFSVNLTHSSVRLDYEFVNSIIRFILLTSFKAIFNRHEQRTLYFRLVSSSFEIFDFIELTLWSQQQCHKLEVDALGTDIFPCQLKRPPNRWHHVQHGFVPNMVLHLDPREHRNPLAKKSRWKVENQNNRECVSKNEDKKHWKNKVTTPNRQNAFILIFPETRLCNVYW